MSRRFDTDHDTDRRVRSRSLLSCSAAPATRSRKRSRGRARRRRAATVAQHRDRRLRDVRRASTSRRPTASTRSSATPSGTDLRRRRARRAAAAAGCSSTSARGAFAAKASACSSFEGEVFPLGIPVDDHGHAARVQRGLAVSRSAALPKLRPYVGGGLTSYGYQETSRLRRPTTRTSTNVSAAITCSAASEYQDHALARRRRRSRRGPRCRTRSASPACRRRSTKPISAARRFRLKITIGR